jgi:hypothetical protein
MQRAALQPASPRKDFLALLNQAHEQAQRLH